MRTVTYPHLPLTVEDMMPLTSDASRSLVRVVALLLGCGAVMVQVTYTWATLPSGDWPLKVAPVLFAVGLAVSLVFAERHFRAREVLKSIGWFAAFGVLLLTNLASTVTRVAEVRALRAAESVHTGDVQADARQALQLAISSEKEARAHARDYCGAMLKTTVTSTEPTGKRRARTTSKTENEVDPRCATWREAATAAEEKTSEARTAVANSVVSSSATGVSPAAKSVAMISGWDAVTIDHAVDFLQPLGLDALALMAFLTAFSSNPRQRPVRQSKTATAVVDADGAAPVVKGIPQAEVTRLVESWIADTGLPIGQGMGASLKMFCEWARIDSNEITFVTFGRAFDALGVERRTLNGRKIIAGMRSR